MRLPIAGGGSHLSFQDTGYAFQIVKVLPIKSEKSVKSVPTNPENILKIVPINPQMPVKLTNKWIFTRNHTYKSGNFRNSFKSMPTNPYSYHLKGTLKMTRPRTIENLSYILGCPAPVSRNLSFLQSVQFCWRRITKLLSSLAI